MNQKLKQYFRIFIDHRQEQQLDWLAIVKFIYNNKVQMGIKVSLFKTNNRWDLYIELEVRKKRKFERTKKFVKKMKEIYEKIETVLRKN